MSEQTKVQAAKKPAKPFDPIGSLLRHWLKIVVFGSIILILLSPLIVLKKKASYKTEGNLLVSPNVQALFTSTEETFLSGYYRDFVKTQCELLKGQKNLEKTLESLSPETREIFASNYPTISSAAAALNKRLEVEYTYGTYIISISLEGDRPEGLAEVINTAMDTYIEKITLEAEGQETRRLKYLEEEKERIESEISGLTNQYKELSKEIGTVDFREAGNIQNNILVGLQEEHIRAYSDRVKKENSLNATIREAATLQKLPIDGEVEDFVLRSTVASEMDIQTYREIQQMKESLGGLAENNPDRAVIEEQIQNLSDSLGYLKDMLKTQTRETLENKRDSALKERIVLAQTEYEAALASEEELKAKIDSVLAEKVAISNKILDGQQIDKEITNLQAMLTRIEDRINVLRMEARAPGRISIATNALYPEQPSGNNFKKLMAFCFVFAFGGIILVCISFDLYDNRIRSRKDIMGALGAKVSWPISNYNLTRTQNIPFSRATIDDSLNVVSKAIHSLSIRLDKERREKNAKVAVFTGIDANSGTTDILINVAYAMTKVCGRVLVLDANLVNPGLNRDLDMENTAPGLVDLLVGEESYKKYIVRNEERCFDVLPAGRELPLNEINLIDRSKITSLLSELKDQYDFILVDTTPMLVSDFTEFFALQADIISLVVQGDRSKYSDLYMTGEIFSRLLVKSVAVVLNWGGPRERTLFQVAISKILEPITKRIVISPIWDVRHISSESDRGGAESRGGFTIIDKIRYALARYQRQP